MRGTRRTRFLLMATLPVLSCTPSTQVGTDASHVDGAGTADILTDTLTTADRSHDAEPDAGRADSPMVDATGDSRLADATTDAGPVDSTLDASSRDESLTETGSVDIADPCQHECEHTGTSCVQGDRHVCELDPDGCRALSVEGCDHGCSLGTCLGTPCPAITNPTLLSSLKLLRAEDMVVLGDVAHVVAAPAKLVSIHLQGHDGMTVRSTYTALGRPIAITAEGDLAYLALSSSGIEIVNIADPAQPTRVAHLDLEDLGSHIMKVDDHLYRAAWDRIDIVSVEESASPQLIDSYQTQEVVTRLAASGDLLVATMGLAGLEVIDISERSAPQRRRVIDTPGSAQDAVIHGEIAYIADGTNGLVVVDVGPAASSEPIGALTGEEMRLQRLVLEGPRLYGAGSTGLHMIDVSDPSAPILEKTIHVPDFPMSLALRGDLAYVAGYSYGIHAVSTTASHNIQLLDERNLIGDWDIGVPHDIATAGAYAFVTVDTDWVESGSIRVLGVGDPGALRQVARVDTRSHNLGIAFMEPSYALYTDGLYGTRVLDVSDPADPSRGRTIDSNHAIDITTSANLAFVADGGAGIKVFDTTAPAGEELVGELDTPGGAVGVAVQADHLYVADLGGGFCIVNVEDPSSPELADCHDTDGEALDVAVQGSHAYIAADYAGLQIYDVGQPQSASLLVTASAHRARGVSISGNYAFVASDFGVIVFDVTSPEAPEILDSVKSSCTPQRIAVSGKNAFYTCGQTVRSVRLCQ